MGADRFHQKDAVDHRLRAAYPTGLVDELDEAALDSAERDERMREALAIASGQCQIGWVVQPFKSPAYEIAVTQQNHPRFSDWVWQMSNEQKLAWIRESGEPYPVLWLKISRVADYYWHYFNHWVPRGDTGYLDADCQRDPNVTWTWYRNVITASLDEQGFAFLRDALARSRTELVKERDYDSVPDDDPRWDDEGFEPPLVPATVYTCLFGV